LISSHQLNEVVSEDSCNKCVRDFNISWHNYNKIYDLSESVVTNKLIEY
jgi:hypothetical protein